MNARMTAVLALLAAPGLALAENVSFSVLAEGNFGAPGAKQQLVIKSQAELDASGLAGQIDPSLPVAPIDWNTEMLIALKMGTQSSGGHSTRVVSIETSFLPTPAFDPFHPPNPPPLLVPCLSVTYAETHPWGPALTVITAPFQLVKLARHDTPVLFQMLPSRPFDTASLTVQDTQVTGSFHWSSSVYVESGGQVTVFRSHPAAFVQPVMGNATAAELDRLSAAVQGARASSLPDPLDVVIPMHLLARPFNLQIQATNDPQLAGSTSGQYRYYGQYDGRVRPVIEALEAIAERVRADNAPQRRAISGVTQLVSGSPVIYEGPVTMSMHFVTTSGAAANVLRRAQGRFVTCDAIVTSSNGVAQSAEIQSVDGKARGFSRLTANPNGGAYRGYVLANAQVKILAVQGNSLKVRVAGREGWLRANKIVIGEAMGPLTTAAGPSTGIVNALPGN